MRTLLALLAAACSSTSTQARAPSPPPSAMTADQPPEQPPPRPQAGYPAPAPAQPAPAAQPAGVAMTAAEAAALFARQSGTEAGAPAATDEGPCASDAECGLTRVAPGACCQMLCAPRVVTKKRADELRDGAGRCPGGCPIPSCRPPLFEVRAACVQRRCVAQRVLPADEVQAK